jgi:predicted MFS family arabinose efflux permease
MVDAEHLTNAVSLNSAVMTGTRIVGPAIAGLLIATAGLDVCFLLNGISFLAVIASLVAMRPADLHRTPARRGPGALREGMRYVLGTPDLRTPLLVSAVIFTFSFNISVLMPLMAEDVFLGDAGTLGSLLSFMGIGSLVGALAMARNARPNPTRLMMAAAGLGVVSVVAAAMPTLPAALAALVVLGLVSIVFMITANTTLQLTSRPEMRGRVMALYSVVFLGGTPVGAPFAGWTAEWLGPRWGIAIGGLIAVAVGLIGLRSLRRHSATEGEPDTELVAQVA